MEMRSLTLLFVRSLPSDIHVIFLPRWISKGVRPADVCVSVLYENTRRSRFVTQS